MLLCILITIIGAVELTSRSLLLALLQVCHLLVLGYAGILVGRVTLDAVLLTEPRLKEKLLGVEHLLLALTDPLLGPIRSLLRDRTPDWLDLSPFIGVVLCLALDYLIVYLQVSLRA